MFRCLRFNAASSKYERQPCVDYVVVEFRIFSGVSVDKASVISYLYFHVVEYFDSYARPEQHVEPSVLVFTEFIQIKRFYACLPFRGQSYVEFRAYACDEPGVLAYPESKLEIDRNLQVVLLSFYRVEIFVFQKFVVDSRDYCESVSDNADIVVHACIESVEIVVVGRGRLSVGFVHVLEKIACAYSGLRRSHAA